MKDSTLPAVLDQGVPNLVAQRDHAARPALLAKSCRQMARPISPRESLVIHQVKRAISLALRPVLTDSRNMSRFLAGCLVFAKWPNFGGEESAATQKSRSSSP